MDAVGHFGERAFGDVQETKPIPPVSPARAFSDIRWNRVRGFSQLRPEFEPLETRKGLDRLFVKLDEEIICALPGDERMMTEIHSIAVLRARCRAPSSTIASISVRFARFERPIPSTRYPCGHSLPVARPCYLWPFLPFLPFLPYLPYMPFLPYLHYLPFLPYLPYLPFLPLQPFLPK